VSGTLDDNVPSGLDGRVVIITGAGKGIGRASALWMAARGACVLVNNRRHPGQADDETSAADVVATIRAAGGQAQANWESVDAPGAGLRLVEAALSTWGRIDAIVANAAVSQAATFHQQSLEEFLRIFQAGFLGSLQLVHAAWPHLRRQGFGRVVFTSSSAGRYGNHGLGAYAASKGAIEMLMRSLAAEGQGKGIAVNAVSPYAATQMTEAYLPAALAARLRPEAVAPVVGWLASPACDLQGEVVVTGGGRHRLARAVETTGQATREAEAGDLGAVLARLREAPARSYGSANEAFASLVAEWEADPSRDESRSVDRPPSR
jgi:NAD(P)-dependent dehydrogenase (short-subunit alcohol dehydrogenase family)